MEPIIELNNISVSYGQTEVIKDISLNINKGDYIGLVGPNGSGKSTLVKAILGLVPLSAGSVRLFGEKQSVFSDWHKIDYLPQNLYKINPLFPASVEEIIFTGLLSSKINPKLKNRNDDQEINRILRQLGIESIRHRLLTDLSGGQQQKVMLGRALVSTPEVLFFDEPATALDPGSRESFYALIEKLNQEDGITVIIITHETGHIGKHANKLVYIDKKLVFSGSFRDFCASDLMDHFFGEHNHHNICHQHH